MTPPEYAHLDRHALEELAAEGVCAPFEKEYIRKDGSRVPILLGAATFQDSPDEGVCFVLDITECKAAKDALDRERNLLRMLIDNLPACIYVKDLERRYVVFNRASVRQLGLNSEAEAFGKTGFDFFPPEIARLYEADDQEVLISGQPITDREEPTQDGEGNRLWYLTTKLPLRDASGVIGLLGISQDITERKQTDQALRESEDYFRFLNDLSEATRMLADPAQIMAVMARMLGEHLRASRCAYADVEQDGEHFNHPARLHRRLREHGGQLRAFALRGAGRGQAPRRADPDHSRCRGGVFAGRRSGHVQRHRHSGDHHLSARQGRRAARHDGGASDDPARLEAGRDHHR